MAFQILQHISEHWQFQVNTCLCIVYMQFAKGSERRKTVWGLFVNIFTIICTRIFFNFGKGNCSPLVPIFKRPCYICRKLRALCCSLLCASCKVNASKEGWLGHSVPEGGATWWHKVYDTRWHSGLTQNLETDVWWQHGCVGRLP